MIESYYDQGVSVMMEQVTPAAIAAVYPVSSIKKIENKRRKGRAAGGLLWDDVLRESIEAADTDTTLLVKEHKDERAHTQRELHSELQHGHDEDRAPQDIIDEVRFIVSGDPERLLESHSSVFTKPVHPGRWVNAQG